MSVYLISLCIWHSDIRSRPRSLGVLDIGLTKNYRLYIALIFIQLKSGRMIPLNDEKTNRICCRYLLKCDVEGEFPSLFVYNNLPAWTNCAAVLTCTYLLSHWWANVDVAAFHSSRCCLLTPSHGFFFQYQKYSALCIFVVSEGQ